MRRLTLLNLLAAVVVTGLAAALVAVGGGAGAATQKRAAATAPGAFRQALAAQLGEQLHKPPADVLAALKSAHRARLRGAGRADRRAARLTARAGRLAARARRLTARAGRLTARARRLTARAGRLTARARRLTARAGRLTARARRLTARAGRLTARAKRLTERAGRLTARAKRLTERVGRLTARAKALGGAPRTAGVGGPATRRDSVARARRAQRVRDAWAAAVAKPLGVSPADVTAALRALVAQRLDSLVHDGWLTPERRAAGLACFDDATRCAGIRRPPGLALLRRGL